MISSRRKFLSAVLIFLVAMLAHPATAWLQEASPVPAGQEVMPAQNTAAPGTLTLPDKGSDAVKEGTPETANYIIQENDTLWDIASSHYRDPFLWPLIWQANPYVENPDLIYPGRQLIIPSLAPVERAMSVPQEPAEEKIVEKAAPAPAVQQQPEPPSFFRRQTVQSAGPEPETPAPGAKLILPEETVPPIADKYMMLSAGFVSDNEESEDYIIGSTKDVDKSIFAQDDTVYISVTSRPDVKVGDRFLIYQPAHTVKHPITKRNFGELFRVLGILQVTKVNDEGSTTSTAAIIKSFDSAEKGSLLMPYQEPTLIYPTTTRPTKNLTGNILDVMDRRTINAQTDFVYLDKGKEDGVDPGDRFLVYADGGNGSGISKTVGEVEVLLVKQRTATAIVKKSKDVLARGDRYASKN